MKPVSICLVLTIVVSKRWPLSQIYIIYAFHHGKLEERVIISQSVEFVDPKYSDHIYFLHHALYGLKQSAHFVLTSQGIYWVCQK